MPESLFPEIVDPLPVEKPKDNRSPMVKLRDRRAAWLAAGYHPLTNVIPHLKLHRDAAPVDDRKAEGLRCGGCANLVIHTRNRSWFKCLLHPSFSDASDVRMWWPACLHFKPREEDG